MHQEDSRFIGPLATPHLDLEETRLAFVMSPASHFFFVITEKQYNSTLWYVPKKNPFAQQKNSQTVFRHQSHKFLSHGDSTYRIYRMRYRIYRICRIYRMR